MTKRRIAQQVAEEVHERQLESHVSFVGGVPRIPAALKTPVCTRCRSIQTFYFQMAFSSGHHWDGWTLAVFACTECGGEKHLVPDRPPHRLQGVNISAPFYKKYQSNFRFLTFPTEDGQARKGYEPRVVFKSWRYASPNGRKGLKAEVLVGGKPRWIYEDETPATYAGSQPMVFLMQTPTRYRFERLKTAPLQVLPNVYGRPVRKEADHYSLFVGNALYFFGARDPTLGVVFVIPQRS